MVSGCIMVHCTENRRDPLPYLSPFPGYLPSKKFSSSTVNTPAEFVGSVVFN